MTSLQPALIDPYRRPAELSSFPLLLEAHSSQSLPDLAENTLQEPNQGDGGPLAQTMCDSGSTDDAIQLSNVINAALPRVSCCIQDASTALTQKQIEQLCACLEDASAILQELIATIIPGAVEAPQVEAHSMTESATAELSIPEELSAERTIEEAPELEQAMAMAA